MWRADFAKIVEVLDAHGASFVSVTQHFNTATSMGRLTLNMLLSFAQFEREVSGERIRGKIAASKRKGMWMGGNVPVGDDVQDRKLVVNAAEAEAVRQIFQRYRDLGSVRELGEQLAAEGILSKGGAPLSRGALFHLLQNRLYLGLLQNRLYLGEVAHKGNVYPGEHAAIVAPDLWHAVQRRLAYNRTDRMTGSRANAVSLLAGLLFDPAGEPMTATHANKGGRRYRYYVSRPLILGSRAASPDSLRIPAMEIEGLVTERLSRLLANPSELLSAINGTTPLPAAEQGHLVQSADRLVQRFPILAASDQRALLTSVLRRIDVSRHSIDVHVVPASLSLALQGKQAVVDPAATTLLLPIPAALRRAGKEMAFLVGEHAVAADPALVRLIAKARSLRAALIGEDAKSLSAIAAAEGISVGYASRLVRLAWLAPDIVEAILEGRQPVGLTATHLMKTADLPLEWAAQRQALGCV